MADTTTNTTDTTDDTGNGAAVTRADVPDSGPEGAICAALSARPDGATVAQLCDATGIARPALTRSLTGLADGGYVSRAPGQSTGRGRVADVWTLTHSTSADADTGRNPDAEANNADGEGKDTNDGTDGDGVSAEALEEAVRILSSESDRRAAARSELDRITKEEDERRARIDAELAAAESRERTRATLTDLLAVVMTTLGAVTADEVDQARVEEGLGQIVTSVAGLRRATRPATRPTSRGVSGRPNGAGEVRKAPEPLRPLVLAHLAAHPGTDFTPGGVARVLDRSSGAVGNAMDTLTRTGEAVMTSETPRRYRFDGEASTEADSVPATHTVTRTDSAAEGNQDDNAANDAA